MKFRKVIIQLRRFSGLLIGLCAFISAAVGQYSNSWIDYSQTYFKIPVAETGVYRITYSDLIDAGFSEAGIDPRWFKIYHRGREQAILVNGQEDGIFDEGDYIEFYGQKNDGTLDEQLYLSPELQPHKYYNLYSDTTAYFLSWSPGENGRRMTTYRSNNVSNIPADGYFWKEFIHVRSDQYATGKSFGAYIQYTEFDQGEGWTGIATQENQNVDYVISGIHGLGVGDKPILEVQINGRSNVDHQVQLMVGGTSGSMRELGVYNFSEYTPIIINSEIEWSDISGTGELVIRMNVQGVAGANDLVSLNYIKVRVPNAYDMEGVGNLTLETKINPTSQTYIEIHNAPTNVKVLDVSDSENVRQIGYNIGGTSINMMLDETSSSRSLYVYTTTLSSELVETSLTNFDLTSANYAVLSHQSLMLPGGGYSNPVQSYADYRASEEGGSYNVIVIDIQDLYNQYSYGEYSPLAIHNFLNRWVNEASNEPEGLFIIGKGLLVGWNSGGEYYRKTPDAFNFKDLVPTAGRPGSDLVYGMGLKGDPNELVVPVGRITASNPEHVSAYLDKVKELESAELDDLWKKRLLHLSGGLTSNELTRFHNHMGQFEEKAENFHLGGQVTTIKKQAGNEIEYINSSQVINSGVNLITIFGHSAPNIVDIDIGYASDPTHGYENKGMYPLLLINGCNAGQVFGSNYLWVEDWALTPELGSIGTIAHTYYGYENALRNYSNIFYKNSFSDSSQIYQPLGNIFKEVIKEYREIYGVSALNKTQTEQMVLLADPAIRLFNAPSPDYIIEDDDLFLTSFEGSQISALVDSFMVGAIVRNVGRADSIPLKIGIERILEDGSITSYEAVFDPVKYQDTVYVVVSNDGDFGGQNRFRVLLDPENAIKELNDENNSAELIAELNLNGTKNILPADQSVVNSIEVNLVVQSANVLEQPNREYLIQVDTVNTFDSPYSYEVSYEAKSLFYNPIQLLDLDSQVYYWRTKFAIPENGENQEWETSSFTYIEDGVTGWAQGHRQQQDENQFTNLNYDVESGSVYFRETEVPFRLKTYGANNPTDSAETVLFEIDGLPYIYSSRLCRDNSVNLVAFSQETGGPYAVIPYPFWVANACGRQSQVINNYRFNEIQNSGSGLTTANYLERYLDSVKVGDYVLLFTIGDVQFQDWSGELAKQVEKIGGDSLTVANLNQGEPYVLFGKKGDAKGTATELIAVNEPFSEQNIELEATVRGSSSTGTIKSVRIGPARNFLSFKNIVALEDHEEQDYHFDIYSENAQGNRLLIADSILSENFDLSSIDSLANPFLRVEMKYKRDYDKNPSRLNFWQVEFEPLPEGVLLYSSDSIITTERQEGDTLSTTLQFVNVSEVGYDLDSLTVLQSELNQQSRSSSIGSFRIKSPSPGDTTFIKAPISTLGKEGLNNVQFIVNDREEPEIYFDNNRLSFADLFNIYKDTSSPILNVLFDGRTISNEEVISSSPLITIEIWDENPYLIRTDTTGIQLLFDNGCDECGYKRINFNSDSVEWSIQDDNRIIIEFQPSELKDGLYSFKALAEDVSGNKASDSGYEMTFHIRNEYELSDFYVYPNPSTESVHFAFNLTGSNPPDYLYIQIMDLYGKTLRVINQEELLPRIGNNSGTYEWDGTDQEGNKLKSGTYIYKIYMFDEEGQIDTNNASSDKGFHQSVGRIVLLR